MKLKTDVQGNVGIITCKGKMLIGEGDEMLREAIASFVADETVWVLLDLSEVPYVDAGGLGELVRSYTAVSRAGGTLALIGLTKRLKDLLSITKLLVVFRTYEQNEKEKAIRELQEYSQ